MRDTEWRSGPPPSIGWWPTKIWPLDHKERICWWDGEGWSVPASQLQAELGVLDNVAATRALCRNYEILWRPRPSSWLPRSFT